MVMSGCYVLYHAASATGWVVNFCFLSLFFILFSYCPNYAFEEMKFGHFCLGNTPVET